MNWPIQATTNTTIAVTISACMPYVSAIQRFRNALPMKQISKPIESFFERRQ